MDAELPPHRTKRRRTLHRVLLVLLLLVIALQVKISYHRHDGPPNILLITVDLMRPQSVPVYASTAAPMPNVVELARRGLVFDHAYAQTSLTSEAHMSLFTSRYMSDIYGDAARGQTSEVVTLADVARRQGYRTACVPGSSLINSDIRLTYFRNVLFSQGYDRYFDIPTTNESVGERRCWVRRYGDQNTDLALGWLREQASPTIRKPWMLHINYRDLHGQWVLPDSPYAETSQKDQFPTDLPHAAITTMPTGYTRIETFIDAQIGRILEYLKKTNMAENTTVIFCADHCLPGGIVAPGDRPHDGALYESEIRVPLIIAPAGSKQGSRIASLVENVDIAPTIADITGAAPQPAFVGKSLLRLDPSKHYLAYSQTWALEVSCVTDGEWKYIEYSKEYRSGHLHRPQGGRELYHLTTDPGEQQNLYPKDQAQATRLRTELVKRRLLEGEQPLPDKQMKLLKPLDYF